MKPWEKYAPSQDGPWAKYSAPEPVTETPADPQQENTWGNAAKNVAQGVGHFATSMFGGIGGDIAGLGAMVPAIIGDTFMGPGGSGIDPARVREGVADFLTYKPENPDSTTMKLVTAPGRMIQGAGTKLADITGTSDIPLVGDAVRAAPLAVAAGLGVKAALPPTIKVKTPALVNGKATTQTVKVTVPGKTAPLTIAGATPEERAQNFVRSRTDLDWDSLSKEFRARLSQVAATGDNLERLDATAIQRQGLLASLEKPITNPTRGQVTRDPLQQRTEQLAKATEAGSALRDIDIAHNKTLTDNLDILRSRTGGKASGELQTGKSVQDALRGRLAVEKVRVSKLYKDAEKAGEAAGPVNIDKLTEYLAKHEDPTRVSYATQKLNALGAVKREVTDGVEVSQNRQLSFKELEGIRKAASNAAKSSDGTTRHYAKELSDVIEDVMAETGGEAGAKYSLARAARRKVGEEFERTQAVARLVKNRKLSHDRATALEDTWDKTVRSGSLEDLQSVRASLAKSEKGRQAWNDLKSATVDYIKNKATGGEHGLKNQAGDLNATWAGLKRAVDDIGPDKMREIFGAEDAAKIDKLVEAAQILKTEAPMGVKGSPTVDKILTFLDRLGSVPGLGKPTELASGAVRLTQKAKDIGKAGRDVRKAQTTPLDEATKK